LGYQKEERFPLPSFLIFLKKIVSSDGNCVSNPTTASQGCFFIRRLKLDFNSSSSDTAAFFLCVSRHRHPSPASQQTTNCAFFNSIRQSALKLASSQVCRAYEFPQSLMRGYNRDLLLFPTSAPIFGCRRLLLYDSFVRVSSTALFLLLLRSRFMFGGHILYAS
jgi:hypothetical protein